MQSGWTLITILIVVVYIAVCFGRIARKHGCNPWLYGLLSVVSPVNLLILGYWAFSGAETGRFEVNVTPAFGDRRRS